jgi:hypothetical protein
MSGLDVIDEGMIEDIGARARAIEGRRCAGDNERRAHR